MKYFIFLILFISNYTFGQTASINFKNINSDYDVKISLNNNVKFYGKIVNNQINLNIQDSASYYIEIYHNDILINSDYKTLFIDKDNFIDIESNNVILNEIIVETRKKFISIDSDKIIYDVEKSPFNKGFNSIEVLSQIPTVLTNDSSINIIGKGDVLIYINNKKVYLTQTELIDYLKTINSENIKKIEVISNPDVKYDSYGNGGIINISIKKNEDDFIGVLYTPTFTYRTSDNYSNNLNLSYKKNKFSSNINLNYSDNSITKNSVIDLIDNNEFVQKSIQKTFLNSNKISSTVITNFKLNNNIEFGADLNYFIINGENNQNKEFKFLDDSNNINDYLTSDFKQYKSITSFYSDIKLDSLGSKINLTANYIFNKNLENIFLESNNSTNINNQLSNQVSLLGDYTLIRKKFSISNGFNLSYIDLEIDNNINELLYKEFIYNLFTSFSFKASENLKFNGGIKYEKWERNINDILVNDHFLLTNFGASYKINNTNSVSLSYNRRLVKPYINYLNPTIIYTSENSYIKGNPFLDAYKIDNFELKYSHNNFLNISLYSNFNKNVFTNIIKYDENKTEINTYDNFYDTHIYGSVVSFTYNKLKKIDVNFFYNLYYVQSIMDDKYISKNGFVSVFYISNNFYLNENKSTFISLSYFLNPPYKAVNFSNKTTASFNLAFKSNLIKDKLSFSISANDIFNQQLERKSSFFESNRIQNFNNDNAYRYFSFSLTYNIGKTITPRGVIKNDRINEL